MRSVDWPTEIAHRMRPDTLLELPASWVLLAIAAALVAALWPQAWYRLRVGITLVHELGHAAVGVAVGRRFTGFVLRGDMSGHAVTWGAPTGAGRVVSTWAGYPAPALLGALVSWLAVAGWAAPTLTALGLGLLLALFFARSVRTIAVTLTALAATGWLWWSANPVVQACALLGLGVLLVIGAWRHLATMRHGIHPRSDPGVLAQLTGVPSLLWLLSFALVCAGATWAVGTQVYDLVALP